MAERYNKTQIKRLKTRSIFFDANVLLYLFWPTGGCHHWEEQYANIYSQLRKQKNDLFVDFIVLSEVVNRAVRIEHNNHLQEQNVTIDDLSFKDYRDSPSGEATLDGIYYRMKTTIIEYFGIVGKVYVKTEIKDFLRNDGLDFSDKGIVSLCKESDFVLLTNDKDFANVDIDILTANPNLLITSF